VALGGFLAGLSQASNQWPSAIQNRMLVQRQAEERAENRALQQQQAIAERLGIIAGTGDVAATKLYAGQLSDKLMPFGEAMVTSAIRENELIRTQQDEARFKKDIEKLKYEQAQKPPHWKQGSGGNYYRTVNGELEISETEGVKKPPTIHTVYPKMGKVLLSDPSSAEGYRFADMDPALTALFEKYETDDAHVVSVNWDRGLIAMSNKQVVQMSPDDLDFAVENMQRFSDVEFGDWVKKQEYKLLNDIELFQAKSQIALNEGQVRNEWDRLKDETQAIGNIYDLNIRALQTIGDTPENAIRNSKMQLKNAGVPEQKIVDLLTEWEPIYHGYAYKLDLSAQQEDFIIDNRRIQIAAEKIHELLEDKDVQAHIGPYRGRLEAYRKPLTGGKNIPKSVIEFRFNLNNMVDAVRRARTGAAISQGETHFYNDLLGTDTFTKSYLQNTMSALMSSVDNEVLTVYDLAWKKKYNMPPTLEQRDELIQRISYGSNLAGANKNTKFVPITVEDVQGKNKGTDK
jgi:hypothetical protein